MQMNNSSILTGKVIKDLELGQLISKLEGDSDVVQGIKQNKKKVTVYALQKSRLKTQEFVSYSNMIGQSVSKVFPRLDGHLQSQKWLYMIFQHLQKPNPPIKSAKSALNDLKAIFNHEKRKIYESQIFMRDDLSLCYLPSYFKASQSSIYGQIQNKQVLANCLVRCLNTVQPQKVRNTILKDWDSQKLADTLQVQIQGYPSLDDDDSQIFELMQQVHVNSDMKKQAGQQYMRNSSRYRQEKSQYGKQITHIMNKMQKSMVKSQASHLSNNSAKTAPIPKDQLSKFKKSLDKQLHLEKQQKLQFDAFYEAYQQIFKFSKIYPKGYTGIITSYLITLVGIIRRVTLIRDLKNGLNIYGSQFTSNLYQSAVAAVKKDLITEGRRLAELKTIIEVNMNIPMDTYSYIAPFLQSIELIDQFQLEDFTFFFVGELIKERSTHDYHHLLTVEFMYILLHRNYEIVHDQKQLPSKWDEKYYQFRKTIIQFMKLNFKLD